LIQEESVEYSSSSSRAPGYCLISFFQARGILTILAGLVLLDFPGKHRVLLWTMSRPAVLKSVVDSGESESRAKRWSCPPQQ
jgi:hypothetical protein